MKEGTLIDCSESGNEGTYLDVRVSPKSSKKGITGIDKWRNQVELSVMERAKDGMANKEVKEYFSKLLNISSRDVNIVKGKTSKSKRLFFSDVERERLLNTIKKELGDER